MYDCIVRIKKINNGFVVCTTDPKIVAENRKPKSTYRNAEVEYAFDSFAGVLKWLKEHQDTLVSPASPEDEFATSFDAACEAD